MKKMKMRRMRRMMRTLKSRNEDVFHLRKVGEGRKEGKEADKVNI